MTEVAPPWAMPEPEFGERLDIGERLIVSPAAGVFQPCPLSIVGHLVMTGTTVGTVGDVPVCSVFSGVLMGFLALTGERLRRGEAVAWLAPSPQHDDDDKRPSPPPNWRFATVERVSPPTTPSPLGRRAAGRGEGRR